MKQEINFRGDFLINRLQTHWVKLDLAKMHKRGKRKHAELGVPSSPAIQSPAKSSIPSAINNIINEPYPVYPRPTPEECLSVRDDLMSLHGFPKQFAKYQRKQQNSSKSEPPDGEESPALKESVLDGLVSTILSQNTTETNSQRAFASLKSAFPSWEDVSLFWDMPFFCIILGVFNCLCLRYTGYLNL